MESSSRGAVAQEALKRRKGLGGQYFGTESLRTAKSALRAGFSLSTSVSTSSDPEAAALQTLVSLDESKILCSTSDCAIHVFDVQSGLRQTKTLKGHSDRIRDLGFDPGNPMRAFSCGEDGSAYAWDLRTGNEPVVAYRNDKVPLTSLALGLQGSLLAVGTENEDKSQVEFYDIRSSRLLGQFRDAHTDAVTQLAFNQLRPAELLTGSLDGLICCFDVSKAGEEEALQGVINAEASIQRMGYFGPHEECVYCITHSESLSLHHVDRAVCIASFAQPRETLQVSGHEHHDFLIDCVYAEEAGAGVQSLLLVSGSSAGGMHLSEVGIQDIKPVCSISSPYAHSDCVRAISPAGRESAHGLPRRLYSCGDDSLLCEWKLKQT